MPSKRKEDKKQEEDIDLSTLPPWISVFTMVEWDPSLSEVASLFPIYQFTVITKTDLYNYSKEKGYIANNITESNIPVLTLAKALSEKISFLDLQGRKQKRDQLQRTEPQEKLRTESRQTSQVFTEVSQPNTPLKPDRIYIFLNFPRTVEEINATARYGISVEFYFYIRPEVSQSTSQFINNFKEALQKSDKNSPLRTFLDKTIVYDLNKYQGMENEVSKIEEFKFDKSDSMAQADTEKQLRSSKTMKKAKEVRDEIATPLPPDLRKLFIAELIKTIYDQGAMFVKYLIWRETVPLKPLFPCLGLHEGLETTSNTTVSYNGEFGRQVDLPSLDDAAKAWDYRVYDYLNRIGEDADTCEYFLICALEQIFRSHEYLIDPAVGEARSQGLIDGNDFIWMSHKDRCLKNGEARFEIYKMYQNFDFAFSGDKGDGGISCDRANYFFNIDKNELKWRLILKRFEEEILNKTGKKIGIDRKFGEKMSKAVLNANLVRILRYDPEVIFCKHDGAALLGLFYDSSTASSANWEYPKKIRPNFQDWKEFNVYPSEFYDIDELKVGNINSQEHSFFPENGGVLKYFKYSVAQRSFKRCLGVYKDWVFGLFDTGKEAFAVVPGYRITADEVSLKVTKKGVIVSCNTQEVLQELVSGKMEERVKLGGKPEKNRVITGKGSVIRYLADGKIEVLYSNGNLSEYNGRWLVTNNKGTVTCKGEEVGHVPCASVTDPHSEVKTTIRDDGTVILENRECLIVEFHDGTKIMTNDQEYLIESPGYAPVKIKKPNLYFSVILDDDVCVERSEDSVNVVFRNRRESVGYDGKSLKISDFFIDIESSFIKCLDKFGNSFQIGLFQEPKQQISKKVDVFNNVPRLFLIEESGEGLEILDSDQVRALISSKSFKIFDKIDSKNFKIFYQSESPQALDKGHIQSTYLDTYSYSSVFSMIKPQPVHLHSDPMKVVSFRYFEKYPKMTAENRKAFYEKYSEYINWQSKQSSDKEFGFSDFSLISFKLQRSIIYEKMHSKKQPEKISSNSKEKIEKIITESIWPRSKTEKTLNAVGTQPNLCESPVKPMKSSRYSAGSVSVNSTMVSFNYFKSPEGLDLSFASPPLTKSLEVQNEAPSSVKDVSSGAEVAKEESFEESPLVPLIPAKGKKVVLKPVNKPSVYNKLDQLQKIKESSEKELADEYHLTKNMNFDIYGGVRKSLPHVSALRSTSPATSRVNLKYVHADIVTETKIRTISQTRKTIFKQPNSTSIRRERNFDLSKSVFVVDYVNDPLRRLLEITPGKVDFGNVLVGQVNSLKMIVKNEDSTLVRFAVKQPNIREAKVIYRPGPIAPGMITKFIVEVTCKEEGRVRGEFEVTCKSEIYTIPILLNAVTDESIVTKTQIKSLADRIQERRLPSLSRSVVLN